MQDAVVRVNGEQSTFVDAYCKLRDSKVERIPTFSRGHYVTEEGEVAITVDQSGDWPLLSAMRTLVELIQQGIDPYGVRWFYYDHDWSRDADESYTFFAVHNNKIVTESCHFSWLEPLILKREPDKEPIWRNHPYLDQAFEIYWYRKFYTETITGQLMVLRPDEPILYHYERSKVRDVLREVEAVTSVKTYRLLWVAIPLLAAIAFPSIREYMAIAAAVLAIDVLWRAWTTRKVGRN